VPLSYTPASESADARLSAHRRRGPRGRASGTERHLNATAYLAAEAARLGLKPGGEDGSYFQTLPLLMRGFVAGGSVSASLGGKRFVLGEDFGATSARSGIVQLPSEAVVVFGGEFGDTASYIHPDARSHSPGS
jgi:hypothetical protein